MRYIRSGFVNFSSGAQRYEQHANAHLIHSVRFC